MSFPSLTPPRTRTYISAGPQTFVPVPLPLPHRRRRHPLWTTVFALLVSLGLSAPVVVLGAHRNGYNVLPHTPTAAEAKQACKAAIEEEAQGRLRNAQRDAGDSAVPSLAGVDIDEPVRTNTGYTVNGAIRFSVMSILGQIPGTVYVTCTATITGDELSTVVQNR